MTKRRIAIYSGVGILAIATIVAAINIRRNSFRELTFAQCEELGGVAWLVDLYHPDICPSCAEFRECQIEFNDYREECPECYGPCEACQDKYSLHESCPECYGPCQACENKYLHDFDSESERHELCPDCADCDACREAIEIKRSNCPPCIACNECKEENRRYTDIGDVCPQVIPCTECLERNAPYPDRCPGGREKIGVISDAAIWFQCCK